MLNAFLSRRYFHVRDTVHQIDTSHFPKGKLPGKCCGMVGGLKKKKRKEEVNLRDVKECGIKKKRDLTFVKKNTIIVLHVMTLKM